LRESVGRTQAGNRWLAALPCLVEQSVDRWRLDLGEPFAHETSAAWVARGRSRALDDSSLVGDVPIVLKIGFPHMEAMQETDGLRFWNGDGTVRLYDSDRGWHALLLEDCRPGTALREVAEPEQDAVIANLLRRLWRRPVQAAAFRPLETMIEHWIEGADASAWSDRGLGERGIEMYRELIQSSVDQAVLATDLHAGNVLRSEREPWLVIDPKPFFGDVCYDVTQHLLNCRTRLAADPVGLVERVAGSAEVDSWRVRAWLFARLVTEDGADDQGLSVARRLDVS
jgi:streptomycin 6-kinase